MKIYCSYCGRLVTGTQRKAEIHCEYCANWIGDSYTLAKEEQEHILKDSNEK